MQNHMEKKMENEMETGLYWGNIGIMENQGLFLGFVIIIS